MWDVKLTAFVVYGVLLNTIGLIGLVGNIITLLVLTRRKMRSSISCLLAGMAACDILFIITYAVTFGLKSIYPYTGHLRYYYYHIIPHLVPFVYPIAMAAQTMSVYLTLIVTIERWIAVCHPLRAKSICTYSRVFGTALFAFIFNVPKYLEYDIVSKVEDGETVYVYQQSKFLTHSYFVIYRHWLYMIVMYVVPFCGLAVFNTCIVRRVWKARKERAEMTKGQKQEMRLAVMLLVVVLVFFLCNMLPLVYTSLYVSLGKEKFSQLKGTDVLFFMIALDLTINHSVNFMIYAIFGKKFRASFFRMICVCARRSSNDKKAEVTDVKCVETGIPVRQCS